MTPEIDLPCDLNDEDDTGESWAVISNALDPTQIRVGALVVAGTRHFWSVGRITAVDDDGQVHFVPLDESAPAAPSVLAPPD